VLAAPAKTLAVIKETDVVQAVGAAPLERAAVGRFAAMQHGRVAELTGAAMVSVTVSGARIYPAVLEWGRLAAEPCTVVHRRIQSAVPTVAVRLVILCVALTVHVARMAPSAVREGAALHPHQTVQDIVARSQLLQCSPESQGENSEKLTSW
jgi:hypothetical protein